MSRKDFFQIRSDADLAKALKREAKANGIHHAELARQLLRAFFALDAPDTARKFAELREREPRMQLAPLMEAMVESYLEVGLKYGVDSRWRPKVWTADDDEAGQSIVKDFAHYLLAKRNALAHGGDPKLDEALYALFRVLEPQDVDESPPRKAIGHSKKA